MSSRSKAEDLASSYNHHLFEEGSLKRNVAEFSGETFAKRQYNEEKRKR